MKSKGASGVGDYVLLWDALQSSADEILTSDSRSRPSWFVEQKDELMRAIGQRDALLVEFNKVSKQIGKTDGISSSVSLRATYRKVKKKLKSFEIVLKEVGKKCKTSLV